MEAFYTSIILGIVEGLTEFLPVSSTGHLIMASDLLHLDQEKFASFNIIIQLGAILAVVFLYHNRFRNLCNIKRLKSLKKNLNQKGLNAIHIAIAIVPTLAIGYLGRKFVKAHLFTPSVVVSSLVIVGVIMLIVEKIKPKATVITVDEITYKDAFIIGISQCFALVPGVSRSGATMLTAMMRKVDVVTAADFSFLISVPVITIATVYEFLKSYSSFNSADTLQLLIGFIVSFIVALAAINGFLAVLKKLSLAPFAIYRIVAGLLYYYFRL
ncbi:MAG: undecaprenyl-diphosphate phosphatase [Bacteriovorax sp.]|nr:undecaprenyl-diphosphate phosphatase [Bacteriovorax sp.]